VKWNFPPFIPAPCGSWLALGQWLGLSTRTFGYRFCVVAGGSPAGKLGVRICSWTW